MRQYGTPSKIVAADLEVDGTTVVVDEINNRLGVGTASPGAQLEVQDTTTSSANAGASLRLSADDGSPMGDSHRLGVIEFTGAEDSSNTQVVGARIEALTDAAWTNVENGCALYFYTTDANAVQTNVLKIDSNQKATFSGEIVAPSLDISGNVDVDGTLEADAVTVDGTALAEVIQDTVGAMVSGNTETGIAVTYEDSDGTLDFALAAVSTAAIADDAVTVAKIEDLARGQIIYGDASAETAKLSPGANGTVLTSDGTDISWQAASGGGSAADDENTILHTITLGL
jgi:hypothetical protein